MDSPSRRVSFNTNMPSHRSPNAFRGLRLKPLTQLKSDPEQLSPAPVDSCVIQQGVLSRKYSNPASPLTSEHSHPSQQSRRPSLSAHSLNGAIPTQPTNAIPHSTSQASLPQLTLGNRIRSSEQDHLSPTTPNAPHPYALILPGDEQKRSGLKPRTMSAVAHSSVGLFRSSTSPTRNRNVLVGARRFTQTANMPVHRDSQGSQTATANQAAALHARRYSSVVREPSAAAMSRNSSPVRNLIGEDDEGTVSQKLTRVDTKMFLVSFNSLLGKDGGGEAVGRLFAFIFHGGLGKVQAEVSTLVKQVLGNTSTLQAAYVTVHFHEIIEQLQKIGGLLFGESEIMSLLDHLTSNFRGFASSDPRPPSTVSFFKVYDLIMDKLTASPVYQSALLKLIETFCKLVLASETLRDNLWATLAQALFHAQRPHGDEKTVNMSKFLGLVFSAVEQLTGGPIKPLVKHFVSWIALVDELLTKLAAETCEFLSQPLPVPIVPLGDYVTHPHGYVYSPTEVAAKLDIVIQKWLNVFTQDSAHKDVFEQFKKALDNVIFGILGNSTFSRFSRDLARVWFGIIGDPSAGVAGTGLQGGLECLKTLAVEFLDVPVGDLKLHCASINVRLSDVNMSMIDCLPSEVSFSTHSKLFPADCSLQSITRLEMKDVKLGSKGMKLTYSPTNASGPEGSGSVDVAFNVDLKIDFIPKNSKLVEMLASLPYYGGAEVKVASSEVTSSATNDGTVHDGVWVQIKSELARQVEGAVQARLDSFFKIWLATPPSAPTKPVTQKHPATIQATKATEGSLGQLPRGPETHGNARDRFKASVRDLTGIKPGAVLMQLQNPLSGPGSPLTSSPPGDRAMGSKRKHRQSMAEYLTDISKSDSTLPENIQRPPVANSQHHNTDTLNLPNVFDEDEDDLPAEYGTMAKSLSFSARGDTTSVDKIIRPVVSSKADLNSVFSHRGGMPSFPTGEMTYEAYALAEASMDEQQQRGATVGVGHQEVGSMAKSLSELATRDTTTEEAIAHPPSVDVSGAETFSTTENMTMDRVTRHLSGVPDSPKDTHDSTAAQRRIIRESALEPPGLTKKLIMADLLTDVAMEDNTLPETQATGKLAGPVEAVGVPTRPGVTSLPSSEMVSMRKLLSKDASIDTTLPENIATPPGTAMRSPPANGFTSLKVVRSMSTSMNGALETDYTTPEGQLEMHRAHRAGEQPVGLTEKEMKMRRQSFKLNDEALTDTTLVESIRKPPVVLGGGEQVVKEKSGLVGR